jgi:2-keto-4-pentenoate hydratase/2-oxohepta-3-ene-1,7-dioic acid hydratase in catechol pathway
MQRLPPGVTGFPRWKQSTSAGHAPGDPETPTGSPRRRSGPGQWTAGKNFWRTGGFGPWLVTRDEIADNQVMTLVTRLNGQEMQRTTTDKPIHSIPRQIAHISAFMPLAAGDVIVTGTPGGVGAKRTPPVWMKAGDVVEIEVDAIGILRNGVRAE